MGNDKFLHDFEGSKSEGNVLGDGIRLMVIVGNVFDVEREDFGIELVCFGFILVGFYLEDDACNFHPLNY
jgi:hypothetical protein